MATNGWYVEKIITDLQSGKVDEFVKKEGKWFNYLKGEATTFTNAADAGSASGNVDFEEFSVQGIGTISGTPSVSGTTPVLGGNIIITVTGGTNWSSTGFSSYNISALPSTGTFTITPASGNTIAAEQFSALALVLTDYITSITFADTGTAYGSSNTVTGTINFDSSALTISSGVTTTFALSLDPVAVQSGVLWSGSVGIIGNFNPFSGDGFLQFADNPGSYIGLGNATMSDAATINHLILNVSAVIVPSISTSLVDFTFTANGDVFFPIGTNPSINLDVPASELSQYSISYEGDDGTIGRRVVIDYIPNIDGFIDDNNYIDIFTDSQIGVCEFYTGYYHMEPNGGGVSLPVTNNLGPFTAAVTFPANSPQWLTINDVTWLNGSAVAISADANIFGIQLEATLSITSDTNTSGVPNDSITIYQELGDSVNLYGSFTVTNINYDQEVTDNGWAEQFFDVGFLTTAGNLQPWTDVGFLGTTTNNGTTYKLAYDFSNTFSIQTILTYASPEDFDSSDGYSLVLVDDATAATPDWINFSATSVDYDATFSSQYEALNNFTVTQNNTGSERSATITVIHPTNNAVSDTFKVVQVAGYDVTVHTFDFRLISGDLANGTATFTNSTVNNTIGELEVSDTSQLVELYGNSVGTTGTYWESNSSAGLTASVYDYDYPITWFNNPELDFTVQLIGGSSEQLGEVDSSWISNLNAVYLSSLTQTNAAGVESLVQDVNHEIRFNISENFAVLGQDESWQKEFPIDRYFKIKGFHPLNNDSSTSTADDIITIKQKAKVFAGFSPGQVSKTVDESDDLSNVQVVCRANGTATPTVKIYKEGLAQVIDGVYTLFEPTISDSNNFLTVDSVAAGSEIVFDGNTVGKQHHIKLVLEPNFTGSNREAKLAIWNGGVSGDTLNELGLPNSATNQNDLITIIQEATVPTLIWDGNTNMAIINQGISSTSGMAFYSLQASESSAQELNDQFMAIDLNFTYNGNTAPTLVDVANVDTADGGFNWSLGNPDWLASNSISVSGGTATVSLSFNHLSQDPGSRIISFDVTHQNGTTFVSFNLRFDV